MSFEEALQSASRDDSFRATVYAMNTLLIHKGTYTKKEFEDLFVESMQKEQRKKNTGHKSNSQADSASA